MANLTMKLLALASAGALLSACRSSSSPSGRSVMTTDGPAVVAAPTEAYATSAPPSAAPVPAPPVSTTTSPPPSELAARVQLVPFVTGLARPLALVAVPGDARKRLWIVEQAGLIHVVEGGRLSGTIALDLRRQVSRKGNEQGLLGLAFHPRFADNGKVYVNFTDPRGDTRVVEYRVVGDQVDPTTARQLLAVKQPYENHNGGHVQFGPDGKLWVGLGDGGGGGDPIKAGQDDAQLLGKMLRLDVDAPSSTPEIVAKGLRNPWRYTFDPATNDLYVADVGQDQWEEIDVVPATRLVGHNFGWNRMEGNHCFERAACDGAGLTPPVVEYGRSVGCSVTGGVVYRGRAIPELVGAYFYADYCTAIIRSFRWNAEGVRDHWEWKPVLDPESRLAQISSFGVDHDGEMYLVSLAGDVYRLAPR